MSDWEYQVRTRIIATGRTVEHAPTDEETARMMMRWDEADHGVERTLFRRRKAGPWVPEPHVSGPA